VSDDASTIYPSRRRLDGVKSAKARSGHEGNARAVVLHLILLHEAQQAPETEAASAGGCDDNVTSMKRSARASVGACPASVESQGSGRRSRS
jgi:hypothetical protein